jgi:hypothetical protein
MSGCLWSIWPGFVDELVEQHLDLGPLYAAHTNVKGFRRMTRG